MEGIGFAFRGGRLGGWLFGIAANGGGLMGCPEMGMNFSGGLCSRLGLQLFLKLMLGMSFCCILFMFFLMKCMIQDSVKNIGNLLSRLKSENCVQFVLW